MSDVTIDLGPSPRPPPVRVTVADVVARQSRAREVRMAVAQAPEPTLDLDAATEDLVNAGRAEARAAG